MATTPVEFSCVSGLTLTAELYPFGSDTIGNTGGDSATEATNRKGLYSFSVTEALAGWYTAIIKEGTEIRAVYEVYMVDDTNIHRCHEHVDLQYEDGAIWLDTVNGTSGTTTFLNGTASNPVSTIADALTLAAALKISRIHVAPGSSVTLAATVANYELYGVNWTLALGSQNIAGSTFIGAIVSGTGTGSTKPIFVDCSMGASTLPPCEIRSSRFTGALTAGDTGVYSLLDCNCHRTSVAYQLFNFHASGNYLRMTNCNGAFSFGSGNSSCVVDFSGNGRIQINNTCNQLTIFISGEVELNDIGTSSVISDSARFAEDQNIYNVIGKVCGQDDELNPFQGPGVWSPELGAIWIDTVNGTAGTDTYVNGTQYNPVSNIADALTLSASLKFPRFIIANGSSITLAASATNKQFIGTNWTLALGGQDISGSYIEGATVSGTATAPTGQPTFDKCLLTTVTMPGCYVENSRLYGTFTMGSSATTYTLSNCVHGFTTPATDVNFTFAGNSVLKLTSCTGYFGFSSAAAGNILEWHGGAGRAHIRNTCNDLVAYISGTLDLLDEGTTSVINDDARYDVDQVSGGGGGGGSPVGPGSTEVEIVTVDDDNNPVDGAAVWITTDEAGINVIAGTLYSGGNGITKFMLDTDMNYWVWRQLSGFNFSPNPEMITLGTP